MKEFWPLAAPQAAIWWDIASMSDASLYHLGEILVLEGPLDGPALRESIARVEAGADALRLRFQGVDGEPRQTLAPEPVFDFALVDFSAEADPEAAARAECRHLLERPFDLQKGPLSRNRLLRVAPARHLWLRLYHHLLIDGFAAKIILDRVSAAYAARVQARPLPEPNLGSYVRYLAEEARYEGSVGHEQDVAYWRSRLARCGPVTSFTDQPLTPPPRHAMVWRRPLGAIQVDALSGAARRAGASFQALLLAAYLLLLGRSGRTQHPTCLAPMLNRRGSYQRSTVGTFVTMVPVGFDLEGDPAFLDLVRQVSRRQRGDFRHGRLTLSRMTTAGLDPWQSGPHGGASFNAMDFPYDFGFPGLKVSDETLSAGPVQDIGLLVTGHQRRNGSGEMVLGWQYNPDRYTQDQVLFLARRYETLLEAVTADPAVPLSRLPALGRGEEETIAAWEQGPALPEGSLRRTVQQLVWRQALRTPRATAVETAGRTLTYAQLADAVAVLAAHLRTRGISAETPVGLCMLPSPEMVVGFVAILASGGAVLPLDPDLPPARLRGMTEGVGCPLVLTQERIRSRLPEGLGPVVETIDPLDPAGPACASDPAAFTPAETGPDRLACIFHTSGTTGRPKPVGVTHGAIAAKILSLSHWLGLGADERVCASSSIAFDPILEQLFLPLTSGGTVWLPEKTLLIDPRGFWSQAAAHRITHLNLVPSMLEALLETVPKGGLPTLRRVVFGGDRLRSRLASRAAAILGVEAVWNLYGPTEATVDATGWRFDRADAGLDVPIGRPLPGYVVRVLDEDMRRVPAGTPGEICIGGPGLARGYLGMEETTGRSFVPDPYGVTGARLYRSGDQARWRDDGALLFLGRADGQVKVRGQRVEIAEVEAALRARPGVQQAAVVFDQDESGGNLTAYLVGTASHNDLAEALGAELPPAAMPGRFMTLEALPLLPSGKPDLLALREAGRNGPGARPPEAPAARPGPEAAMKQAMAEIWAELLGRAEVDPQANLFQMGVHSLMVLRALARLSAVAGRDVSAAEIFQFPSAEALVRHLCAGQSVPSESGRQETGDPEKKDLPPRVESAERVFPASPGQEGLWLERRDHPDSVTYSMPFSLPLAPGQAGPDLVRSALEHLAGRQATLRTVLTEREGTVLQRILPPGPVDLTVHDLCGEEDPEATMDGLARAEAGRPFDLEAGPLFRFHLFVAGPDKATLMGNADHAVFDGWSLGILFRELSHILKALTVGIDPSRGLPPLPLSYAEAMATWRESLTGTRGSVLRSFWRARLEGLDLGEMPGRSPGLARGTGLRLVLPFSSEAMAALGSLAAAQRATPAMVWTAAMAGLLARYKDGQSDVAIGVPFAGRLNPLVRDLIGYFVNVLPVREGGGWDRSFADILGSVRNEMAQVMTCQDYPLAWLSADGAALRRDRLFDVVALLEEADPGEFDLLESETGTGKFPLMLSLYYRKSGGALLTVEYDPGLFEGTFVARMAGHLEALLKEAAARPQAALGELNLLSDPERRQVVVGFNDVRRPFPGETSLAELFRTSASRHANRTAIAWEGESLTYAGLDRDSDRLAAGLAEAGAGPRTVVGLAIERGAPAIAATLAVIKTGAAYLPIDPGFPPALLRRLLADAGARLVVADAPGRARLSDPGPDVRLLALEDLALDGPPPPPGTGGEAPAYVMFTSGTTGEPKGVVVPHRAVSRLAVNADILRLRPEDTMGQASPLAFDAATLEIWAPLLSGARLCLIPDETLLNPTALGARLCGAGVSALWLTTSLFNRLAEEDPGCFRSLRVLLTGGEALSPPHVRRVMEACPNLRLLNGYGPTENTTFTTTHLITRADARGSAIPIGRPIANTRAYVLDRLGNPAPIGIWGELYTGGEGLALGYAGRADLSAASFPRLSWLGGERLYRTGDLCRWRSDGVLEFGGRRDGQVKVRGHRIETSAIEAALNDLPGVRDSAVLAVGQGADRVLAGVVACAEPDMAGWRKALLARLPAYMVPERFLTLPRLPITANGKKDRRALETLLSRTFADREPSGRPPETPGERLLARLFKRLFPAAVPDARADFFDLGGHSLLAMRLAGMIEGETGIRPAVRDLLAARTLEAMAALLDTGRPWQRTEALPRAPGPDFPLSSGQARLWMLQRLYPDSAAYNVALGLDLAGRLDDKALARALTALEERQHALRLVSVTNPGDRWRQRLAPPGALVLPRLDCSHAADPEAEAALQVETQASRPFHLEEEAPARAFLLVLGRGRWRLLLVLHHAACDGWSLPLLWRDLGALYARELDLPGPELPELPNSFEDFAAWQQAFLVSDQGRSALDRWKDRLTPLPEPLALPLDRPRPRVRRFRGGVQEMTFDSDTSHRLESLARESGATPFMLLLALLQVLLYRHTGQTDLAIGTLVAGRDRAAVQRLIGFFVNTLVLRQRIKPSTDFRAHLASVRNTCLDAMADQDCPFELLVESLGTPRDTSRNPLFDVLAVWQEGTQEVPEMPGLEVSPCDIPFPFAKFDLSFHFWRRDRQLRVLVEFDADLFDPAGVEALLGRFRHLIAHALADPGRPLDQLEVMDETERAMVVEGFNDTARPLDTQRTIVAPFLKQAAKAPETPAVLWQGGNLDYRGFASRAAGLSRRLQEAGVRPGDTVALCARRSPEMLVGIYGILHAGAAYAPLDPDPPPARRRAMLEDLGRPLVLASAGETHLFPGERVLTLEGGEEKPHDSAAGEPHGLAYVIFTSGSTGRPKGVMIEHHSVLNRILWMQETFPLGPDDVILHKTPITFDVSVWELFWWSWVGAAVALAPVGAERDPSALVEAMERHRATVVHFVPSMLAEFLTCLEDGRTRVECLSSLKYVFASGEALDVGLVERFNRLLYSRFGTELHNLYGPTEATVDVTWWPCSPWQGNPTVPIGRPIANTRLYVLDPDLRPVPKGVTGEICIAGVQVARGYVNRPDLTAEHFVEDPFRPGQRMYRTGDLGRWRRDGAIEYLGRTDHQVKVRGHRIEISEIEHVLETHPAVERAVVAPVASGGLVELHAYILGAEDLDAAGLRGHLRRYLPETMLPARFFRLESLPLTPSGKVDRKALSGRPLDRPPAAASGLSPFEAELLGMWRELLPDGKIGIHESFFDAGGNSLLTIRLHERLEARWPGIFTVAELFGLATVAEQARRLAGVLPTPLPVETPQCQAGPVAIIGMALRLAGCEDLEGFWQILAAGSDRVRPLPASRMTQARAMWTALGRRAPSSFREAAYLDDVFGFDPHRLRLAPADATLIDPEQRLFLETAVAALEDAGYGGRALDHRPVGVFVGSSPLPYYRETMGRLYPERAEQVFTLNVPSNVATRLSFLHDWRGPAAVVDTACSSALAAVHLACRSLASGECEAALTGSAKVLLLPPEEGGRMSIDSSTSRTRAFAAGADGTGIGEGAVVLLLKPLQRAVADGDAIHGVILGSALNQDGTSSGMAAPNPLAQAEVIGAAARAAGIGLETLSYVEAHGTGTALGDPVEVEGITRAFAAHTEERGFADLGSVKGNYGHLDAAAGGLGLAKAVLCLTHDAAPPQPFFGEPNPRIDFARAPVRVPRTLGPLADRGTPRRAGVSSFGLSGINVHVLLEAPPEPPASREPDDSWWVVGISAASEKDLRRYAGSLATVLRSDPACSLAQTAFTLATGRDRLPFRAAVAARRTADLLAGLDELAAGGGLTGTAASRRPEEGTVETPAQVPDEEAARTSAVAFVQGGALSWTAGPGTRRLHLPAAPFTRRPCSPDWARLSPALPMLGPAVATPQGTVWRVPVEEPDFWPASEHLLEARPTLVGMALPGLLARAALEIGQGPALRIESLRWLRPLRTDQIQAGSATLSLQRQAEGGGFRAVLGGRTPAGTWIAFAEAEVTEDREPEAAADLAALRLRCSREPALPAFSEVSGPVSVSKRWDCRVRAWQSPGGEEALALLRVAPAYRDDLDRFPLHPALLDVATGLVLDGPRVPAGCRTVRVRAGLPAEVLVHAIRRRADVREMEADITLYDPANGNMFLSLRGLRFVTPAVGLDAAPLSMPAWTPRPLKEQVCPGPLVVVGEGALARGIMDHLAAQGLLVGSCGSEQANPEVLRLAIEGGTAGLLLAPSGGRDLAWRGVRVLQQLLTGLERPLRVLIAGHGAYALDDADPVPGPEAALLAGLALASAREEPLMAVRYLDTDPTTPASSVAAEFRAFDSEDDALMPAAMLRAGVRYGPTLVPLPAGNARPAWPSAGCCVVTGGLGGLALTLAEEMADGGRLALALLSRSGRAGGEEREADFRRDRLSALEQAGVRVGIYTCDVSDRGALEATLQQVRAEMGHITAVVHAAGVADGAFVLRRERAEFQAVLDGKVEGARHLDVLTRSDPLEAFVLFGSLTGLAGAPGQAAYAAANTFLASLAHWRRSQGRPALCIDWCPLQGVGMAARSRQPQGRGPSLTAAGARAAWRAALSSGLARVTLAPPQILSRAESRQKAPDLAAVPPVREADLSVGLGPILARIWAEVLGYDRVGPEDNFFSLGGDSITGMQVVERIVADTGRPATLNLLFETADLAALTRALEQPGKPSEIRGGPIPAPPRESYPVAWEQLAVLRAEVAGEMGTAFNLPGLIDLPSDLDERRIEAALQELVARHETLRTRFRRAGDDFLMEILPPAPIPLPKVRMPSWDEAWPACLARVRPFDLFSVPPVRFELLSFADNRKALFCDLHHSVADGLSLELLVGDLAGLYAGSAGPAPSLHLKDYAWWSREGDGALRLGEDRRYWLERFVGSLPMLDLPADRGRPARHTWAGDTVSFEMDRAVLDALRRYAAARKTTAFSVVLAAWAALVHRFARTRDVVIAVPVDSRDMAGFQNVPGMMVSLLPLRLAVEGSQPVSDLVAQAQTVHVEALGHRTYNLGMLLADLAPPASPDRTLLSEVTLSYMNFPEARPAEEGRGFRLHGITRSSCKNDLGIFIRDLPDRMLVSLEYYADLFDRERIEGLGRQFSTLLTALVEAPPETCVNHLLLIPDDERERILAWGRGSRPELPLNTGLFDLFAAEAGRRGNAVAVEQTGLRMTYADLACRSLATAQCLLRAGVRPGDRVAVHMQRGAPVVATLLGILASGAAYVPLDPAYPAERNAWILEDAECRAVVADGPGRAALPALPGCLLLSSEEMPAGPICDATPLPRVDGSWPAYLMYTSGSTGRPKGVLVPQRGVIRLALGEDYAGLGHEDRVMQTGPLAFDASTFEIWAPLLNGARLCVAAWEEMLDPANLSDLIRRFGVTVLWLTTGLFNRQVEHDPASFRGPRVVITGGEVMSLPHIRKAVAACPGVSFFNGYGPTENTTFTTVHPVRPQDLEGSSIPIGRPIPHSSVYILDEAGEPAPIGVWGEIHAGGLGLAEGYWNRPELTEQCFVPHPLEQGGRLYRTGDLGRWRRDGTIEFAGRRDTQIKLRGLRIELEEIERALSDHPAVGRAVAMLHRPGGGEPQIAAALLPAAEGLVFDVASLRRWLGRRLPAYMVPSRLVTVEEIPVTANGKVDRNALLARLEKADEPGTQDVRSPRTAGEYAVAEIFSEVFGRPLSDLRTGFLDLGGHSLMAIKVVNRLAERTGVRLSMREFYGAPTLADLARLLSETRQPIHSDIPPAPPAEVYPTSHSQQRLYLLHGLEGGSGAYNMAFAFRCSADLDPDAVREALQLLARRHEPLRTGFEEREGEIVQRILPEASPVVLVDDLRGSSDAPEEVLRLARREIAMPFDLGRPPLVRARVMRVAEDETLMLLVLHHIVGDGWSSRILVRELGALYAAARNGKEALLRQLPLTYKDFAVWQRSQTWQGAAGHWRRRLAGAPQRIGLPTDRPLPQLQSYRGATCRRELPAEVLQGLHGLAKNRGATMGALGVALFAALLYRLTRQKDMLLGMGVAGRERAGLEGLIGFFVNVLPIRLQLDDDTELEALIDQAQHALVEALDHRDYPFDMLVRDVAPQRETNRQPLMNVVFEYQNFGSLRQEGDGLPLKKEGGKTLDRRLQALVDSPTAKHDLLLFFVEEPGRSYLQLEYDTDILDSATAERWLGFYAQFAALAARSSD